jgi:hypothetical protein
MKRAVLLAIAVVLVVLAWGGAALAASPQDIYDDYAADQKLDGTYSDAELQAFLDSAVNLQYADQTIIASLKTVIAGILNDDQADDTQESDRGTFPFTGAQLLLVAVFAVGLIAGGVGLHHQFGKARG